MEAVVAVAIAALLFLFFTATGALIGLCCHRYCRMLDFRVKRSYSRYRHTRRNHNISLVSDAELPNQDYEVELRSVYFSSDQLSDILADEKWVDDATGLIPHCIQILKTCHDLTDKLVAMTVGNAGPIKHHETLGDIVVAAKKISPRVDDVVKCLYPPIDLRLIEARSAALLLSVQNLALITKFACQMPTFVEWIDISLSEMEEHLTILRDAALQSESDSRTCSISSSGAESAQQPSEPQSDPQVLGAVGPALMTRPCTLASVL